MKRTSHPAEKYILRFERAGHRDEIKEAAARHGRSMNKHLLHMIALGTEVEAVRSAIPVHTAPPMSGV